MYVIVSVHFVEKFISFSLDFLDVFVKNQLIINIRPYFWILDSIPLIYMLILMPLPHCLDSCGSVISVELRKCEFFNFVLNFQDCFFCVGSFEVPCRFQNQVVQKVCWDFDGDYTESINKLRKDCFPNNIQSCIPLVYIGCLSNYFDLLFIQQCFIFFSVLILLLSNFTVFFSKYFILLQTSLLKSFSCLVQLELQVQYSVEVVGMGFLVLFLILGGRPPVFHH